MGGVAVPCPAGTYGPNEGLQRLRDCTVCPAGIDGGKPFFFIVLHCFTSKHSNLCNNISVYVCLPVCHFKLANCSRNILMNLSINTFLKGFTAWKAAHRDPPPSSCAHRAITVKRALSPLMGHLALLVQLENNWVRQVGQPVRDVEKDVSVLQVSLSTNTLTSEEQQILEY